MKPPCAPPLDERRAQQVEAELFERARAWIPTWGMGDDEHDFGRALLKIAARFSSEVTEGLDRGGERMRLAFLDWLAVPAEAARPARTPVVFKLVDNARQPVLASAGTRLQVEAAGLPVILETEKDVLLLPSQLKALVGVNADSDAFYLPPPGLSSLAPLEALPVQWQLKSFASTGAAKLQLDPELGLAVDMLVELGGRQYRLAQVDKDIVTIERPLAADQAEQAIVTKVAAFTPFDSSAQNRQEHALYLGSNELFDVEAAATIEIVGAKKLVDLSWQYWGKAHPDDAVTWQPLTLANEAAQAKSDAIVLEKRKGSVELLELVKDKNSRWIRAIAPTVQGAEPRLQVDRLEVRINCPHGATSLPAAGTAPGGPAAEGMANTTPLVLDGVFFPFGKEPRQFDAFYLGSKEAFSKKGADVAIDFEMADTTFSTLSVVRGGFFAGSVLAGVAQDGALHLLQVNAITGVISKFLDREPLRPPSADGDTGATLGVQLNRRPQGRPPVWQDASDANGFLVAAAAADSVWVWQENSRDQNASTWISFGSVPSTAAAPTASIDDLLYLADTLMLVALRGGQLSSRKWPDGPQWTPLETKDGAQAVVLKAIVLVLAVSGDSLTPSSAAGMVGVADDGKLYQVAPSGTCSQLSPTDVSAEVRPVAVKSGANLSVVLAQSSLADLVMFHSAHGEKAISLPGPEAAAKGFDAVVKSGVLYYLASVQRPSGGYLASWKPHATAADDIRVLRAPIPAGLGQPDGAPAAIGGYVVAPGRGGDLLVTDLDLTQRLDLEADVGEGVFTSDSAPEFAPGDLVAREIGPDTFDGQLISQTGMTPEKQAFYLLSAPFAAAASGPLHGLHLTGASRVGDLKKVGDHGTLQLEADDRTTLVNAVVRVGSDLYRVTGIDAGNLATLKPKPAASAAAQPYWSSAPITSRISLFIRPTNNNWDAALLDRAVLWFTGASPPQQGKAFSIGAGNRPLLIELSLPWDTAPALALAAPFVLDAAVGSWTRSLGDTSTNPELSWEYWNGTGWWKLILTRDGTLHLKKSGRLEFKVPADLASTDWSGRTNYWIRARLIGGDYGRESVSVATSPRDKKGFTHQTVERSTKDIHAPSVVRLAISYEICENALPAFVLTKDSGSLRDQSDANRTAGANVEAFVPVAVMLGRLSGTPNASQTGEDCPADCQCPGPGAPVAADGATAPTASAQIAVTSSPPATGRAVYLGFDTRLSGEPVNVLLLIEERDHDRFAPLAVEALIADHFVPIVVNDTTRALGESGVLTLAFAVPPTPRELFGKTLTWLRLTPKVGTATTSWRPTIRGAYLNAVWAAATETLTYEFVGSSQGEPNLTLFLAKPPILRDTLELRVREPLGDDERDALAAQGADQVLSAVANLPGDWVLWRRVIDPLDESPTERVYALDDATGEIRFGDGRYGRIPPVGRDSIVAFKYQRTETGAPDSEVVPANTIAARTVLNLASPVAGVEAVFAADQAAGGASAESTERVLRFGVARLRHRERALTAHDVEDLALASSPDIAQARCFMRNGVVRLVVMMRGVNPMPSAAQVRELSRLLLAEAPPSLSARQVLRIGGPAIRRLRVNLRLRVATLDDAGAVARDASNHIIALFDTLTGGPDESGWQLGENPTEGDIAMALANVPRLEGIASVDLREIAVDCSDRPWPGSIRPTDLAMLHEDVIRVEFEAVEVPA